jgi:hypothetical protein
MTKTQGKSASATVKDILLQEPDGLRDVIRLVLQEVLEAEMDEALGASKSERTPERLGYRSGYYSRTLITRVGKLELRVPQDRQGRFSTELFERYQRSEQALVATLAEMYVQDRDHWPIALVRLNNRDPHLVHSLISGTRCTRSSPRARGRGRGRAAGRPRHC